jgi:hypothetical protein
MSLVKQLNVVLRDFVPVEGAHVIHDPTTGYDTVISQHLSTRLQEYAQLRGIPFSTAFAQLREDINRKA